MGDNFVHFVTCDPWATPSRENKELAREVVRRAVMTCDEIDTSVGDDIKFFFNIEGGWETFCPRCGRRMAMKEVTDWLTADYDRNTGFHLTPRAMPCCGASLPLDDLAFEPPAAFARCAITLRNPKWVFENETPSAPEVKAMVQAFARTRVMDERWGQVREAWSEEIKSSVECLAERVGDALMSPVRVVWSHL